MFTSDLCRLGGFPQNDIPVQAKKNLAKAKKVKLKM